MIGNAVIYRGGAAVRGFGLGAAGDRHSWAETSDLLNAYVYAINQIAVAVQCGKVTQIAAAAPTGPASDWADEYLYAYAQFKDVRDAAVQRMRDSWWPVPDSIASATSSDPVFADYGGNVFDALEAKFKPFVDLDRRLRTGSTGAGAWFPASCLPAYPHMPQPTTEDYSLDAYKGLDAMVKGGKQLLHDAAEGVKDFVSSPPILFLGTVILVASGAVIVSHLVPKREERVVART